jgi:hypothetical protein
MPDDVVSGRDFVAGVNRRDRLRSAGAPISGSCSTFTHDAKGNPLPDIYGNVRDPQVLLYDLQNDPQERTNVANQNPQVRDDLLQQLTQWRNAEVARRDGHDPVLDGLSLAYNDSWND